MFPVHIWVELDDSVGGQVEVTPGIGVVGVSGAGEGEPEGTVHFLLLEEV